MDAVISDTRLWIFQSDKDFNEVQLSFINANLPLFLEGWAAHGNPLVAKYSIKFNRFLLIEVDESVFAASGCSIDKLIRFIESLEAKFQFNLRDRQNMTYLSSDKIESCPISLIKQFYESGILVDDTLVFVNNLSKGSQLSANWQVPFKQSGYWAFR